MRFLQQFSDCLPVIPSVLFVALVLSLQGSVSIVTGSWYDWVYEELAYGSFEFILLSEGIEAFYHKTSKYYAYKLPLG